MTAPVVTLCNLKGGVGKTSTTFHLGGTLAREGRARIVVDAVAMLEAHVAFDHVADRDAATADGEGRNDDDDGDARHGSCERERRDPRAPHDGHRW